MLKNHWRLVSRLERVADNCLVLLAFFLTYYSRDFIIQLASRLDLPPVYRPQVLGALDTYLVILGAGLPLFNVLLSMLGAYRSMRFASTFSLLRLCLSVSAIAFLCLSSFLYLCKFDLSRSFLTIFTGLSGLGFFLERVFVLGILRFFRARGKNFRNVLIVGTGAQARRIYLEFMRQRELGVRIVGFVDVSGAVEGQKSCSHVYDLPARVVCDPEGFEDTLKKYVVDEVFCTDVERCFPVLQSLAQIAAEEGVQLTLTANLFSLEILQSDMSYFGSIPLIHYHSSPGGRDTGALVIKRSMDVVIASMLLVILSPFLLLVALLVKLDSPGPVFFRQRRVGKNGRIFTLLKFRSMIQGAEKMLPELSKKNEMSGPVFKLKNDPRVTKLGKILRRFSIDELPQLINVLRGDMSLVGPRPPLPNEVSKYLRKQRRRLSMRPGLTCTWQVSGRNDIQDFDYWTKLDLDYIDNWSLWRDVVLLFRTIPVVVSGAGAR